MTKYEATQNILAGLAVIVILLNNLRLSCIIIVLKLQTSASMAIYLFFVNFYGNIFDSFAIMANCVVIRSFQ